jgi:hypothetical protein
MQPRLAAGDVWRCWLAEWSGEVGGAVWVQFVEKLPNPVAEPEWHPYLTNFYVRPALLRLALEACDARRRCRVPLADAAQPRPVRAARLRRAGRPAPAAR